MKVLIASLNETPNERTQQQISAFIGKGWEVEFRCVAIDNCVEPTPACTYIEECVEISSEQYELLKSRINQSC